MATQQRVTMPPGAPRLRLRGYGVPQIPLAPLPPGPYKGGTRGTCAHGHSRG